jgi:hypothetical protein
MKNRFCVVQYAHDETVTEFFSQVCNLRVIWGGNQTIHQIQNIPVPAGSADLTFPDRFSFCIIDADAYSNLEDKLELARRFYNDAYWFDQMACSSPRLIVWVGDAATVSECRKTFWDFLERMVLETGYKAPASQLMNKIKVQYAAAFRGNVKIETVPSKLLHRVIYSRLPDMDRSLHCGSGLFFECIASVASVGDWLTDQDQTVTYLGLNADQLELLKRRPNAGRALRFVPIGKALEFANAWDGYDLLYEFSKPSDGRG